VARLGAAGGRARSNAPTTRPARATNDTRKALEAPPERAGAPNLCPGHGEQVARRRGAQVHAVLFSQLITSINKPRKGQIALGSGGVAPAWLSICARPPAQRARRCAALSHSQDSSRMGHEHRRATPVGEAAAIEGPC
jgi:hypothetical protein